MSGWSTRELLPCFRSFPFPGRMAGAPAAACDHGTASREDRGAERHEPPGVPVTSRGHLSALVAQLQGAPLTLSAVNGALCGHVTWSPSLAPPPPYFSTREGKKYLSCSFHVSLTCSGVPCDCIRPSPSFTCRGQVTYPRPHGRGSGIAGLRTPEYPTLTWCECST